MNTKPSNLLYFMDPEADPETIPPSRSEIYHWALKEADYARLIIGNFIAIYHRNPTKMHVAPSDWRSSCSSYCGVRIEVDPKANGIELE